MGFVFGKGREVAEKQHKTAVYKGKMDTSQMKLAGNYLRLVGIFNDKSKVQKKEQVLLFSFRNAKMNIHLN